MALHANGREDDHGSSIRIVETPGVEFIRTIACNMSRRYLHRRPRHAPVFLQAQSLGAPQQPARSAASVRLIPSYCSVHEATLAGGGVTALTCLDCAHALL